MEQIRSLKVINPAAGAIVMALGIFLYSTVDVIPWLEEIANVLVIPYLLLSLIIFLAILFQVFQPGFITPFIHNPVNSFVMGSWVAGFSIVCNVIHKFIPGTDTLIFGMAILNSIIFVIFLGFYIRNFKELVSTPAKYTIHGVVLLSTVSTQSIVILWIKLVPSLSNIIFIIGISLGLCFYLCGVALIAKRYFFSKDWSLSEDWANTNCILHGALSISGLALVLSHWISPSGLTLYWLAVFILLIIIETIEILRAVVRVKGLGWRKGVFTYQISQWSRNFTFGMFFAFTNTMAADPMYANIDLPFQRLVLSSLPWIILVLLIVEIYLWIDSKVMGKRIVRGQFYF
ncbi:hypothetical protein [Bacillus sp. Marseille-Q1617]|uniref:hypothetical protein n=1 Tax=Bacillus sp. Marseille-Q1617 TaxID=2736887 RepID=UPI00158C77A2|nr:hypothetical protein [Bacillus sp. Marseille-Q1617]